MSWLEFNQRVLDEATLEGHLREFTEAQLVVEADDSDEEYSFRHALTREVVYDDLLVRERKRFHRAVAIFDDAKAPVPPTLLLGLARADAGAGHLVAAQEAYNRLIRQGTPPGAARK